MNYFLKQKDSRIKQINPFVAAFTNIVSQVYKHTQTQSHKYLSATRDTSRSVGLTWCKNPLKQIHSPRLKTNADCYQ